MAEDLEALIERRTALLDAWVLKQRQIAVLQAEAAALLAQRCEVWDEEVALAPTHRDAIERSMLSEYAAAGHVSTGTMEHAFADARLLAELPAVRESFTAGSITASHVREIIRESQPVREAVDSGAVEDATLGLYEAAVLDVAENGTPARTRAHARQVAAALAGSTIVEQHERALQERSVTVRSVGDGLALLQAVLPEHLAVAIHDRLTSMSRHMRRHPEDRDPVLPPVEEPDDVAWEAPDRPVIDPASVAAPDAIFGGDTFSTDPFEPGAFGSDPFDDGACDADRYSTDPFYSGPFGTDEHPEVPDLPLPPDPMFHDDSPCIIHVPSDSRTMDQIRADLLVDLLLASDPSEAHGNGLDNVHATIQVTVAATTLADQDDRPGELDGHGPLHPDTARVLAGNHTGWTRLFADPTGLITESDTYTPPEPMRRYLRARDQHCRFPGCRMPIHRCELDHNLDYALGGRTTCDNLAHFCLTHHAIKHPSVPEEHRWTARQLPDRTVEWISPNGRHYPDPAPRRVMFVPSGPPDPWASPPPTASEAGSPF